MTPCVDYVSNVSGVFTREDTSDEDCFPHVLVTSELQRVAYEMQHPGNAALVEGVLLDTFCKKVAFFGTRNDAELRSTGCGLKYIGEWHEVDDARWVDANSAGECYAASARSLLEYLCSVGLFEDSVCITAGDNCPLYVYNESFMLVCRSCDVHSVDGDEKYYRVALLDTVPGVVYERVPVDGNFWRLMGNPEYFELIQTQQLLYAGEAGVLRCVRALVMAHFAVLSATRQSVHCIQLLNLLFMFMRRIKCINWLDRVGLFAIVDDAYGIIDGKCFCAWHPGKFLEFFDELAAIQGWRLYNAGDRHLAEIHMPGIILSTPKYTLFPGCSGIYQDSGRFSEEFSLCSILIKSLI